MATPRVTTATAASQAAPGGRPRARASFTRVVIAGVPALMACALVLVANEVRAAPGQAERLGGVQAQGPATRSTTALHHNPAMLAQMPGLNAQLTLRAGMDALSVARFPTAADGEPTGSPGAPSRTFNPAGGYFIGASFRLDPVAIGAGVYTLGSRFRPNSSGDLRYHLRTQNEWGCTLDPSTKCPDIRRGGGEEHRTDWTLALAWNAYDKAQIGAAFHVPRLQMNFAREEDTSLNSTGASRDCGPTTGVDIEDPRCSERLTFDGRTRLRWFGLNPNGTRFDFAMTFGIAVPIGDRTTVGLRYRTPPLLDRGRVEVSGESLVCLGAEAYDAGLNDLPRCKAAKPVTARITQRLPQEVAVGAAVEFGRRKQLALDANLFWTDYCPGGIRPGDCAGRDAPVLSLVGLDKDSELPFEGPLYRGRTDAYGVEIWGRYDFARRDDALSQPMPGSTSSPARSKPNVSVNFGGGFISPAIRPSALTANDSEGWKVTGSVGTTIELRQRGGSILVVPGYGLDLLVPTTVGPGGRTPAYRPSAAQAFANSGGDINGPGADAVLSGRGRPTNAGRYVGSSHLLTLTLSWAERDPDRAR